MKRIWSCILLLLVAVVPLGACGTPRGTTQQSLDLEQARISGSESEAEQSSAIPSFARVAQLPVPAFDSSDRIRFLGEEYTQRPSEDIKAASLYSGKAQIMGYLIQFPVPVQNLLDAGLPVDSYSPGTSGGHATASALIKGLDGSIHLICTPLNHTSDNVADGPFALDSGDQSKALSNALALSPLRISAGVFLPGGITVGSSQDEVIAAWGKPTQSVADNTADKGDYYFEHPSDEMDSRWRTFEPAFTSFGTRIHMQYDSGGLLIPASSTVQYAANGTRDAGLYIGRPLDNAADFLPTKYILPVPASMFSYAPSNVTVFESEGNLFAISNSESSVKASSLGTSPVTLDDKTLHRYLDQWVEENQTRYTFMLGSVSGNPTRGNRVTVVDMANGDKVVVELLLELDAQSVSVLLMYNHSSANSDYGESASVSKVFMLAPYTEGAVVGDVQIDFLYNHVVQMAQYSYLSTAQWRDDA